MGWGWEDRSKREGERREGGLLGREMGVWLVERERERGWLRERGVGGECGLPGIHTRGSGVRGST